MDSSVSIFLFKADVMSVTGCSGCPCQAWSGLEMGCVALLLNCTTWGSAPKAS